MFHVEHPNSPEQLLAAIEVLQQRVNELEESLERQERLATLGTIAGLIAHEFNNILTPVMSYAQMALAAPEDRELALKALTKASDGADRAGQIAGAILGLVRRDHAPAAFGAMHRCDLGLAIQRALECLARPLEKDGIRLQLSVSGGVAVAARSVAVEHVLLNLIINARSAMLPRGGELQVISSENVPQLSSSAVVSWSGGVEAGWPTSVNQRANVVIEVSDSGRGMTTERMARLFDLSAPTNRESTSSASTGTYNQEAPSFGDRRGHGLGMLVCKRLVEDAGGAMAVESTLGVGTRVWVVWPAAVEG